VCRCAQSNASVMLGAPRRFLGIFLRIKHIILFKIQILYTLRSMHRNESVCRLGRGTTCSNYCRVERNGTADVATPIARWDHRKSKFGLRHALNLIELYCMTKSEI
jgi:hypothetical protein